MYERVRAPQCAIIFCSQNVDIGSTKFKVKLRQFRLGGAVLFLVVVGATASRWKNILRGIFLLMNFKSRLGIKKEYSPGGKVIAPVFEEKGVDNAFCF